MKITTILRVDCEHCHHALAKDVRLHYNPWSQIKESAKDSYKRPNTAWSFDEGDSDHGQPVRNSRNLRAFSADLQLRHPCFVTKITRARDRGSGRDRGGGASPCRSHKPVSWLSALTDLARGSTIPPSSRPRILRSWSSGLLPSPIRPACLGI